MKLRNTHFQLMAASLSLLLLMALCSFNKPGLIPEALKPATIPADSFLVKKETISLEDAIFRGTTPEETLKEYLKNYDFLVAKPISSDEGEIIKTHALILKNTLHLEHSVKLNIQLVLKENRSLTVYTFAREKNINSHGWQQLSVKSKEHLDIYLTRFMKGLERCVNRDKPKLTTILVMPDTTANSAFEQIGISTIKAVEPAKK